MKKTALFIGLLLSTITILPLKTSRTEASKKYRIDIELEDVTKEYAEIDNTLHYYKISVINGLFDFAVKLPFETIDQLGYKKPNSQDWSNNFWKPFICGEIAALSLIVLASNLIENKELKKNISDTGIWLAIAGLIAHFGFRHNKAADLNDRMIVKQAYNQIDIYYSFYTTTTMLDSNFIVFSTAHALENIKIDVSQNGLSYEISLTEE